jgi:hypothetical protein
LNETGACGFRRRLIKSQIRELLQQISFNHETRELHEKQKRDSFCASFCVFRGLKYFLLLSCLLVSARYFKTGMAAHSPFSPVQKKTLRPPVRPDGPSNLAWTGRLAGHAAAPAVPVQSASRRFPFSQSKAVRSRFLERSNGFFQRCRSLSCICFFHESGVMFII